MCSLALVLKHCSTFKNVSVNVMAYVIADVTFLTQQPSCGLLLYVWYAPTNNRKAFHVQLLLVSLLVHVLIFTITDDTGGGVVDLQRVWWRSCRASLDLLALAVVLYIAITTHTHTLVLEYTRQVATRRRSPGATGRHVSCKTSIRSGR